MSAFAAVALLITMFFPWYSVTAAKNPVGASLTAWGAFGLVQVLVLLISLGTLVLLFVRGESRALGAQSADTALLVTILGSVAAIAVLWGMFDRPGGGSAVASGIEWGIVIALLATLWLAWTGFSVYRRDRDREHPAAAGRAATSTRAEPRPERRLTRREQTGGGEPPEAARWVEPSRDAREPAPRRPAPDRGERSYGREDVTQLSLELPQDHFDE